MHVVIEWLRRVNSGAVGNLWKFSVYRVHQKVAFPPELIELCWCREPLKFLRRRRCKSLPWHHSASHGNCLLGTWHTSLKTGLSTPNPPGQEAYLACYPAGNFMCKSTAWIKPELSLSYTPQLCFGSSVRMWLGVIYYFPNFISEQCSNWFDWILYAWFRTLRPYAFDLSLALLGRKYTLDSHWPEVGKVTMKVTSPSYRNPQLELKYCIRWIWCRCFFSIVRNTTRKQKVWLISLLNDLTYNITKSSTTHIYLHPNVKKSEYLELTLPSGVKHYQNFSVAPGGSEAFWRAGDRILTRQKWFPPASRPSQSWCPSERVRLVVNSECLTIGVKEEPYVN